MDKFLSQNFFNEDARKLSFYRERGGYSSLEKAFDMTPAELIDLVKSSGLRGRGGAGFPTGMKWGFVPKDTGKPIYLCVNCDESEPGTFKDREIVRWDPHLLIEGLAIAAYALDCHQCYIYMRGEFRDESKILQAALDEAVQEGWIGKAMRLKGFDLNVTIHMGAGAYICGEETALLNSVEGKRGYPRLKPPFPAVEGLFQCPTIVNNVETLANLPLILEHGVDWFRSFGTEKAPGLRLYAISGHVEKPGVVEAPVDINLLKLLDEHAGGILGGRKLKAVIPGGASASVLKAEECDVPMDFESLAAIGTMAGSGAVMVMDESTDMVHACRVLSDFFAHESCGQCTPCREGSSWLNKIVRRIDDGEGKAEDLDLLFQITGNMKGRTVCVFSEAAAAPVESFVTKFPEEFKDRIQA